MGDHTVVQLMPGRDILREHLLDADVLLVRSVTRVNRALLEGTSVKYVGTATAGVDHVAEEDLQDLGIRFQAAPGCNAQAVVEYVIATIAASGRDFSALRVGIVGCGQVGGRLYHLLKTLGCQVGCYDPFLTKDQIPNLTSLEDAMSADVVSLHTPLTYDGEYPTHHMIGEAQLDQLRQNALLISAGRGGVINEHSLLEFRSRRPDIEVALDVWEAEPIVPSDLSLACRYITPHIAGYSELAKLRGAKQVLRGISGLENLDINMPREVRQQVSATSWQDAVIAAFDPAAATRLTRRLIGDETGFDQLRKGFGSRLEFSQVAVECDSEQSSVINKLGFLTL